MQVMMELKTNWTEASDASDVDAAAAAAAAADKDLLVLSPPTLTCLPR